MPTPWAAAAAAAAAATAFAAGKLAQKVPYTHAWAMPSPKTPWPGEQRR